MTVEEMDDAICVGIHGQSVKNFKSRKSDRRSFLAGMLAGAKIATARSVNNQDGDDYYAGFNHGTSAAAEAITEQAAELESP